MQVSAIELHANPGVVSAWVLQVRDALPGAFSTKTREVRRFRVHFLGYTSCFSILRKHPGELPQVPKSMAKSKLRTRHQP